MLGQMHILTSLSTFKDETPCETHSSVQTVALTVDSVHTARHMLTN